MLRQNEMAEKFRNFRCGLHTAVWKNAEFTLTGKLIRQISYLVLLVETLFSRKFCQISV